MQRRTFVRTLGVGLVLSASGALPRPRALGRNLANGKVVVAVAGVRGRGRGLLETFGALPEVEVKYVCDIDSEVLAQGIELSTSQAGRRPQAIRDYRRALDDASVDALVLGTPDHWHALPTIHACQAGKDVYVEKPDGHNVLEGRTMVAAARKHGRIVQLGTQARSGAMQREAMDYIGRGHLGRVVMARAWESSRQKNLGHPSDGTAPSTVDYDLWLGPAPLRPYNPLRFHSHWRWFFDYGTGDLGNDGVHRLDVARWGLETAGTAQQEPPLGPPRTITATGGKYYFDDAQQWPDTLLVNYDFGGKLLTYEMRIWSAYHFEGEPEGAAVYGDGGYVVIGNERWRAFDERGKLVVERQGGSNDRAHAQNFIDCLATRARPHADLETVGQASSLLCHLGNAAWRAGRTLRFDADSYTFKGDEAATRLLARETYRAPWLLPKLDAV